jgi:Leucine-rich repeat (LRR) protein
VIFFLQVNLISLYIQNNSISALSPQVFSKLERLQLLDLSRNSLTSQWIKEDLFQGLIRVVVINLSYNQLTRIDAALFKDQISLQALHLQNNQIDFVSPAAFQSLSNLHTLDLSHNRLSYIDGATFSNLLVLTRLFLDHNQIRKMDPDSLNNCTTLEDLGLSRNLLEEVPAAFQSSSLGLLKTLDIGENKITRISNLSFVGMSQLYGLRMVENFITEIPDGFCSSVPKIRVLNFSHNKIRNSQIGSRAFTSCPDLKVLRLDNNAIEELPPTLAPQLPSLLWFNVSGNRLKWTDYSLLPPTVEWVDLSYNSIESLTGPVAQTNRTLSNNINNRRMPLQLRVLDISYNKLEHLDQTTLPASLETLRVNHNQLKAIAPNTFILSTRIRRVELMGNQIQNLPLSALSLSPIPLGRTMPEFYLGDNPFLCCGMDWMLDLRNRLSLLRTLPRIIDLDRLTCTRMSTNVESSAIIPIGDASPRDFLCKYTSHCSR